MERFYKGFEITVEREKCLAGYDLIYYSVFKDHYEVASGFYDGFNLKVRDVLRDIKDHIIDNPEILEELLDE